MYAIAINSSCVQYCLFLACLLWTFTYASKIKNQQVPTNRHNQSHKLSDTTLIQTKIHTDRLFSFIFENKRTFDLVVMKSEM